MIPYDDLVVALQTWRARQGLPVAQLSGALTPPPAAPVRAVTPPSGPRTAPPAPPSGPRTAPPAPPPLARPSEESIDESMLEHDALDHAAELSEVHDEHTEHLAGHLPDHLTEDHGEDLGEHGGDPVEEHLDEAHYEAEGGNFAMAFDGGPTVAGLHGEGADDAHGDDHTSVGHAPLSPRADAAGDATESRIPPGGKREDW